MGIITTARPTDEDITKPSKLAATLKPSTMRGYLHMVTGGVTWVGDFSSPSDATEYATELSIKHDWIIYAYHEIK